MKLNDEAPEQHLAIIVLSGLFLIVNLTMAYKDSHKHENVTPGPEPLVTQVVDDSGATIDVPTNHRNPTLSWSDLIFCRGLRRSSWCSYRELHPDQVEADENGVEVQNAPAPKKDHVVAYRGPMVRESAFSGRVSIPEEDISDKYRDLEASK